MSRKALSLLAAALPLVGCMGPGVATLGEGDVDSGELLIQVTGNRWPVEIAWSAGDFAGAPALRSLPWTVELDVSPGDKVFLHVCNGEIEAEVTLTARVVFREQVLEEKTATGLGDPGLPCDPEITIEVELP